MDELTGVLAEATRDIGAEYFHLSIDGADPVYRERVYCYELYHQMRMRWPVPCKFYLNGEIDKSAHPILRELGASHVKPDLLVHRPGYMTGNHAIIEVKSIKAPKNGIRKDLKTLSLFINKVRYQRAIYLLYGYGIDDKLINKIVKSASQIENRAKIELWVHAEVGQAAIKILNLE